MEEEEIQKQLLDKVYEHLASAPAPSLAVLIEKQCDKYGISQRQLSQILDLQRPSLSRILEGEAQKLDVLTLLKIQQFLGLSVETIIKTYVANIQVTDIKSLQDSAKATFIVKNFDLEGLKRCGFIKSITDLDEIEHRLKTFLGLENILEYETEVGSALFSRNARKSHDKMRELWVKSAYIQFDHIKNPNPYSREALISIIPKIIPYTQDIHKGLLTVVRALYNIGVTVIAQPYLTKTSVRGATFIINNKPCIVLTSQNYATLWFTLMHELHHALYDFEAISTTSYHVSGESDVFLIEEEANSFAKRMLLSDDKLIYIKPYINTPQLVQEYARRLKIHPSIIYQFYLYDVKSDDAYKFYSKYLPKSDSAFSAITAVDWTSYNETLIERADITKQVLSETK
ncbi:helix-turn-helix domain-containing protein [Adhaeribacter aquaticus]|uniref:helix-turn-helix domain-containing protein n=1 Tax=Adhaeribacter aquaticus TaxID=299567 RepID=UPI00040E3306|nr:helix-turn-helix domain-containing protein [Adhaeribacter aquaticus]